MQNFYENLEDPKTNILIQNFVRGKIVRDRKGIENGGKIIWYGRNSSYHFMHDKAFYLINIKKQWNH